MALHAAPHHCQVKQRGFGGAGLLARPRPLGRVQGKPPHRHPRTHICVRTGREPLEGFGGSSAWPPSCQALKSTGSPAMDCPNSHARCAFGLQVHIPSVLCRKEECECNKEAGVFGGVSRGNMQIGVYGAGYLGTVVSACLADFGTPVSCCHPDRSRMVEMAQGNIPFFEKNLKEIIRRNVRAGRLAYSTDLETFAHRTQVIFMAEDKAENLADVALRLTRLAAEPPILTIVTPVPVG